MLTYNLEVNVEADVESLPIRRSRRKRKETDQEIEKGEKRSEVTRSNAEIQQGIVQISEFNTGNRRSYFKELLGRMELCTSFDSLMLLCIEQETVIDNFFELSVQHKQNPLNIMLLHDTIDSLANELKPDIQNVDDDLFPVQIYGDGNCLPRCGSLFVNRGQDDFDEIRCRIIVEQVLYQQYYLNSQNLGKGHEEKEDYAEVYAMSSPSWSGEKVNGCPVAIQRLYEAEIMHIRRSGVFMGIWQIHALANVLRMHFFSVYPQGHGMMSADGQDNTEMSADGQSQDITEMSADGQSQDITEMSADGQSQDITEMSADGQDNTEMSADGQSQDTTEMSADAQSQDTTEMSADGQSQDTTEMSADAQSQDITEMSADGQSQDTTDMSADGQDNTDMSADAQSQDTTEMSADGQDNTEMSADGQDNTEMSADGQSQDITEMSADGQDITEMSADGQDITEMSADGQDNTDMSADGLDQCLTLR